MSRGLSLDAGAIASGIKWRKRRGASIEAGHEILPLSPRQQSLDFTLPLRAMGLDTGGGARETVLRECDGNEVGSESRGVTSILDVPMRCLRCGTVTRLGDCEPCVDHDTGGEGTGFGCPVEDCGGIMVEAGAMTSPRSGGGGK